MLQIRNLTKIYNSQSKTRTVALNNVSADFGDKGLVFILGKSGSGKSTLLNLLGGIDTPTEGEIIIDGKSSKGFKPRDFDGYRNSCVGFVFQEYNLLPEYSVGRNVALALELQSSKEDKEKVEDILRRVELVDREGNTLYERKINELSGGQKQRVAIARALVKNPKIILADEPTGALDSATGESLYNLLKELAKDRLVLVVTHDIDCAQRFGDRIIKIADGEIVADTAEMPLFEQQKTEKASYARGRLPAKRAFFMGAQALKHKKLRLGVCIFLSAFMCFIFGLAFTASTVNETNSQIKAMYNNNLSYVILESSAWRWEQKYHTPGIMEKRDYSRRVITDRQKTAIDKYFGTALRVLTDAPIWPSGASQHLVNYEYPDGYGEFNGYLKIVKPGVSALVELHPGTGEQDAGLTPDSRFVDKSLCRLPRDFSEIAISDAKADLFMRYNYKDEDGNISVINTPDDLIGKKIGELTIVGIYSTEEAREKLLEYDRAMTWEDKDYDFIEDFSRGKHIINFGFVCEGYFLHEYSDLPPSSSLSGSKYVLEDHIFYLVKLSGNRFADRRFFESKNIKYTGLYDFGLEIHEELGIISPYSFIVSYWAEWATHKVVLGIAWGVGAVFMLISGLLITSYLNVSIEFRKRETGILRALGATRRDVVLICFFESLLIACMIFALALAEVLIACAVLNAYLHIPLLIFELVPLTALVLICFGITALAAIVPARRIANKKPVDIINGK